MQRLTTQRTHKASPAKVKSTADVDRTDTARHIQPVAVAEQRTQPQQTSRKKSRSKASSLQALLGKSRPQGPPSGGFGLNFADLLKR
ncbi:hypothetical protein AMS68_005190 [Peltaster fructicola]|uniref:Uncharacterized protein n=1 Tax=Peltaster fructicola TaxID=286661 RepID=A0A6H0XY40_9PEZI|nr:hypothetical protein AMS68_005190 [Peltaster fructicola]